ncbi:MAG: hypothetical protein WCI38_05045 [Chthoniobacterales bacterium]
MSFFLRASQALGCAAVLLLAGCQSLPMQPSPDFVPDMVVSIDYAQFFRLGPQQAGGADLSLRTNEHVMLLHKEFGYSRVQLENGQVGYIANEDIQPAPEPPPEAKKKHGSSGKKHDGSEAEPKYEDDLYENIPPPDANLNIKPEDVPLEPLPDLLPEPVEVTTPASTPQPTPVKETLPEALPPPEQKAPVSTST